MCIQLNIAFTAHGNHHKFSMETNFKLLFIYAMGTNKLVKSKKPEKMKDLIL